MNSIRTSVAESSGLSTAARWRAALVAAGFALACIPGVPAAAALIAGAAIALTVGNPVSGRTGPLARKLLPAAVIGLGAGMNLEQVARAGARGLGYTVVSIGTALALGWLLSRLLSVDGKTGTLVTIGTAICGGSAIAAAAPVIDADDREMSVALGTVFLLNSVALVVFPPLGHAPAWASRRSVCGRPSPSTTPAPSSGRPCQYGPVATAVATTVKLARALWIVPVTLGLGLLERRRRGSAAQRAGRPPWFILGFLLAAAATTYLPALRPAGQVTAAVAKQAMVLTLYLIGLGLSRDSLRAVGRGRSCWACFSGWPQRPGPWRR